MSLLSLCNATATISRPTAAATDMGGTARTQAVVYSSIPASFQPANGRITEMYAKRQMVVDYVCYTPTAISLQAGDVVVNDAAPSILYNVVGWGDMAGRAVAYQIDLQRST